MIVGTAVAGQPAADAHVLVAVVDRDVGVGLEEADLALALQRHAAGGDVGDAAVGEAQARVGDVDGLRQHRDADGLDALHVGAHEAEDDVEVVDHQIEDDVDVGAALGERRQAVALDEARLRDDAGERADRRVEALEMADLQDAAVRVPPASTSARPSATVAVIGFSTSTSMPCAEEVAARARSAAASARRG